MDPIARRRLAYDSLQRVGAIILLDDIDDVTDGIINEDSPWGTPMPHHWTVGAAMMTLGVVGESQIPPPLRVPSTVEDAPSDAGSGAESAPDARFVPEDDRLRRDPTPDTDPVEDEDADRLADEALRDLEVVL